MLESATQHISFSLSTHLPSTPKEIMVQEIHELGGSGNNANNESAVVHEEQPEYTHQNPPLETKGLLAVRREMKSQQNHDGVDGNPDDHQDNGRDDIANDGLDLMQPELAAASSKLNYMVRTLTPETLTSTSVMCEQEEDYDHHHHHEKSEEESQDWCIKVCCPLQYPPWSSTIHLQSRAEPNKECRRSLLPIFQQPRGLCIVYLTGFRFFFNFCVRSANLVTRSMALNVAP